MSKRYEEVAVPAKDPLVVGLDGNAILASKLVELCRRCDTRELAMLVSENVIRLGNRGKRGYARLVETKQWIRIFTVRAR